MSLHKLFEELSTIVLSEFDAEMRFRAWAASGSREQGVALLETLDAVFGERKF